MLAGHNAKQRPVLPDMPRGVIVFAFGIAVVRLTARFSRCLQEAGAKYDILFRALISDKHISFEGIVGEQILSLPGFQRLTQQGLYGAVGNRNKHAAVQLMVGNAADWHNPGKFIR
ncbi:hypothetical protein D3C75_882550 [compost metagenome]